MKIYLIWRVDTLDDCCWLDKKIFLDMEKAESYVELRSNRPHLYYTSFSYRQMEQSL